MTDTLYRWVKASDRLPEKKGKENSVVIECKHPGREFITSGYRNFSEKHPALYMELGSLSFLTTEGKWDFHSTVPVDSIYWLEPYTPSLNAGSLEQDFKEINVYLNDLYHNMTHDVKDAGHLWIAFTDKFNAFRERVLAGAAYVKGGGNITADVMMDVYRTVQVDGSIKEEDKLSTTFRWIYELVQESIKPSRPSLDIDKVVDELRNKSPYSRYEGSHERTLDDVWEECCNKLSELLNQKEGEK